MPNTLILIGIFIGINMGILGIGGGMLLIPMLVWYGFTLQEAVAASLILQLLPQTFPGVYAYHRKGLIRWRESLYVVLGSLIGVAFGSYIGSKKLIKEVYLYRALIVFMIISIIYIIPFAFKK